MGGMLTNNSLREILSNMIPNFTYNTKRDRERERETERDSRRLWEENIRIRVLRLDTM